MSLTTGGHYTGPPSGYRDYAQRQKDKGEAEYASWQITVDEQRARFEEWLESKRELWERFEPVPAVPADFSRS